MTIGAVDRPSLLASLLESELRLQPAKGSPAGADGAFAEKLDQALNLPAGELKPDAAQALAEQLNLKMLHSTLALATDTPTPEYSPLLERGLPSVQALINRYAANLPSAEDQAAQPAAPPQPLPEIPDPQPRQGVNSTPTKGAEWLEPIIVKASRKYGVEVGLIKAVIKAESNFNPNAVSHAGARGLMQLMPGTARGLGVNDSFDPEQNVMAGTRFLKDLLNRYNGNLDSALAAYNWGPGNVDKKPDRLPAETRNYLVRVKQLYASYTG